MQSKQRANSSFDAKSDNKSNSQHKFVRNLPKGEPIPSLQTDPFVRETKTSLLRKNANLLKKLEDVENEIVQLGGKDALDLVEEHQITSHRIPRYDEALGIAVEQLDRTSLKSSINMPPYRELIHKLESEKDNFVKLKEPRSSKFIGKVSQQKERRIGSTFDVKGDIVSNSVTNKELKEATLQQMIARRKAALEEPAIAQESSRTVN